MTPLSPEMIRLVLAARAVAYTDSTPDPEDLRELDQAAEAFALVVPWDDEPEDEEIDPLAGTPDGLVG